MRSFWIFAWSKSANIFLYTCRCHVNCSLFAEQINRGQNVYNVPCRSKLPEYSAEFLNVDGQSKRSSSSWISWSMGVHGSIFCTKKGSYLLCYLLIDANLTALQICSQVFYLCFPSPSAASEPSGLHALTFSCNINVSFHLIWSTGVKCLMFISISDLSACYPWPSGACILHYLCRVSTFLGWDTLSSPWTNDQSTSIRFLHP